MTIEDMDRKMAVRVLGVRSEKLKADIRTLPLPDKFRLAAEFLESGTMDFARWTAQLAMSELEQLGRP